MQLTKHTDFGLRTLIYLGLHPGRRVSTAEIAGVFGVPKNHLRKVVSRLALSGTIRTQRGKGGGTTLAMRPEMIRIGSVVRELEGQRELISCDAPACPALPACGLRGVMAEAQEACLAVLDHYTLSDVLLDRTPQLRRLLSAPTQ